MSDRSFRDRLARIADNIDLEQLDGLVNRVGPDVPEEEQPNLHRLIMNLEQNEPVVVDVRGLGNVEEVQNEQANQDEMEGVFDYIPNFWGLVGAHRTPLNRAIRDGKYELAEKLIASTLNPEALNDGSMVHALSTGKSVYNNKRPRSLKIVRLLLDKGASPNFRSPNVLDLPSMTPFEMAINYYLDLLKHKKNPRAMSYSNEGSDLMNTIGLSGEDWLDLQTLVAQAKELIKLFIESGADINLQTTNSGRTIFHEVMSSEVSDFGLIDRMVSMGALVNLTDVHGTTPLMDLIRNSDNTLRIHADLTVSGKRLLFDAQNCTGETALWRSMFYGKMDCTSLLLYDNSNTALQTRVQGSLADFFVGSFGFRPFGIGVSAYTKKRPSMKSLPALLAPLLFDSPCNLTERNKTGQKNGPLKLSMLDKYSVTAYNQVIKAYITPFVSKLSPEEVNEYLGELIKTHTDYTHLIEDELFKIQDLGQMLFGNALQQKCIRILLNKSLFSKPVEDLARLMNELQGKIVPIPTGTPVRPRRVARKKTSPLENHDSTTGDSACATSDASPPDQDQDQFVRSSTPFPTTDEERLNKYDDNWYLGESPRFTGRKFSSLEDDSELEISTDQDQSGSRQAVTRLHRMLQDTDDRLERLQSEVAPSRFRKILEVESDIDSSDDEVKAWLPKETTLPTKDSEIPNKVVAQDVMAQIEKCITFPFGKLDPKVLMNEKQPDPRFDEAVVRMLTPKVVENLRLKLGLAPGLKAHLELEVARLQLGAALFHHSTIKCDRGCEGNDDESDLTSEDSDEDDDNASTTSWDDSISEPSSGGSHRPDSSSESSSSDNEDGLPDLEQPDQHYDPSVPPMPRILSDSSEDDESMPDLLEESLSRLHFNASGGESANSSFFNFGGSDEHNSIRQYVQQMVQEPFDHSTDSETDDEAAALPELL